MIVVTLTCSLATVVNRSNYPARLAAQTGAFGPEVGAVADLTWGIPRTDVDRTVNEMRAAGISWVRANQNWSAAEPDTKGVLNEGWLADVDYAVNRARASGIEVLMPISDGVPYWASADPAKYTGADGVRHWNKLWQPTNVSDYAAFTTAMVNRYKALGVHTYEVWNEQNVPYFWPSGPSATAYTALLRVAYPAIKAADPTAKVILGGLSKNDYDYLGDLYTAGAGPYFDAVAVHPYTGAVDPTWCWNQAGTTKFAKDAFCGIEEVRNTMVANGDSAKGIWLTEFGWSTTTAAYGVSEAVQASFLTAALTRIRSSYPYVTNAFWYNFRNTYYFGDDPTNIEANWGLLRTDFSAKPALAAIKAFNASVPPVGISISDATGVEAAPGATTSAAFTVSLSAPAPLQGVTVMAATANGSATAGSDYTAFAPTQISFAPGETTKTVTVAVIGDAAAEGNETMLVNLSSQQGAVVADAQGLATILDDEGLPTLSVSDATVVEGGPGTSTSASVTVSLSAPAVGPVTVRAATANGWAVAGSDYTALAPTTVSFAPGERTKTVTVAATGDAVAEGDEWMLVNLSAPVGAALADAQGVVTVLDDEGSPTLSVSDATVVEGGPGTSISAAVTVSLSAPAAAPVTVRAATANGSATAGSDYTALAPITVSFAAGETTKTVTVPVKGDAVAEGDETFTVNLSSPVGAVLADSQGLGTIVNDDGLLGLVQILLPGPTFSISDATVVERAPGATTTAVFTVSLSAPAPLLGATVVATTANGSAIAGSDYTALARTTINFAFGETTKTVTVAVAGDAVPEGDETFVVTLSAPVGAVLADAQGLGTILDDEGAPTISISDATAVEGAPGVTTNAAFTVKLSEPSTGTVTVRAATANGSAVAGSDYAGVSGLTLTFAPGETTKTVLVPVTGDAVAEGNETLTMSLSAPVGALLADAQGLGTLLDDEGAPTISVSDATAIERAPGTTTNAAFTVSLSAPAAGTVTVKAATANGSAIAGSDYAALAPTTVSFAPGERTKTVTVAVTGDAAAEGNETLMVNLSVPVGAAVADVQGLGTILDDEGAPTISISDATVVEGAPGVTTNAAFTVKLSAPAAGPVTVRAATANGSALAGSDYAALSPLTVTFAPGETTKTVVVAVTGDATAEGNETFVVNLSAPVGAVLADAQGLGTIINDD